MDTTLAVRIQTFATKLKGNKIGSLILMKLLILSIAKLSNSQHVKAKLGSLFDLYQIPQRSHTNLHKKILKCLQYSLAIAPLKQN